MAIGFGGASALTHTSSGTWSGTYTVSAGSNFLILAFAGGNVSDPENSYTVIGGTSGSAPMTFLNKYAGAEPGNRYVYIYGLASPGVGLNMLNVAQTGSNSSPFVIPIAADYSGVSGLDAANTPSDTGGSTSTTITSAITTVTPPTSQSYNLTFDAAVHMDQNAVSLAATSGDAWVVSVIGKGGSSNIVTSPGLTQRAISTFDSIELFDTAGPVLTATGLPVWLYFGQSLALGAAGKLARDLIRNPIRSRRRFLIGDEG